MQYAIGIALALLPVFIQPYIGQYLIDNGYASSMDVLAGRFVGSTTYAFAAFRIFGAAAGGTPKGADATLDVWIAYSTGALDPQFDKESGKPIRPQPDAIPFRLLAVVLRVTGLSIVSSISKPFGGQPATHWLTAQDAAPALLVAGTVFDYVLVQLMLIYLFLSLLMDVGALLLLAQNYEVLVPFDNPIFASRSSADFWGKRWNIQGVHPARQRSPARTHLNSSCACPHALNASHFFCHASRPRVPRPASHDYPEALRLRPAAQSQGELGGRGHRHVRLLRPFPRVPVPSVLRQVLPRIHLPLLWHARHHR